MFKISPRLDKVHLFRNTDVLDYKLFEGRDYVLFHLTDTVLHLNVPDTELRIRYNICLEQLTVHLGKDRETNKYT